MIASVSTYLRKSAHSEAIAFAVLVLGLAVYTSRRLWWIAAQIPDYYGQTADWTILLLATLGLLGCAGHWSRESRFTPMSTNALGVLFGLLFFVQTLGCAFIDPQRINWLLQGVDWGQHFLGWHTYRSAPWTWPWGANDSLWYPIGTSVVYTDSLPLLALPLKVFSPWLPQHFQYIGAWFALGFMLHGVFAARLLSCLTPRPVIVAAGTMILLASPILLTRIHHDTLTAQWTILAALWLYFRPPASARSDFVAWALLCAIAALSHPYFSVMILAIAAAFYLRAVASQKTITFRSGIARVFGLGLLTVVCWWVAGGLMVRGDRTSVPFGLYSANLLTWFDSRQLSLWLPDLPSAVEQYEGNGYLGLGVLLLATAAIVAVSIRRKKIEPRWPALWPLLAAIFVLCLLAFSTRIICGSIVLLDITPKRLLLIDAFRASGRFIWPSCYLIGTLSIAAVARMGNRPAATLLIVGAMSLQLLDLQPLWLPTAMMRTAQDKPPSGAILESAYWTSAVVGRKHITIYPHIRCSESGAPYVPFALLAGDHGMTVNSGYVARYSDKKVLAYCMRLEQEITGGIRHADELYIVRADLLEAFRKSSSVPMHCTVADGQSACVVAD